MDTKQYEYEYTMYDIPKHRVGIRQSLVINDQRQEASCRSLFDMHERVDCDNGVLIGSRPRKCVRERLRIPRAHHKLSNDSHGISNAVFQTIRCITDLPWVHVKLYDWLGLPRAVIDMHVA
jgi:hypothetical protein